MKKRFLLIIAFTLGFSQVKAQQNIGFWNKASLEASYGFAMPISPTKNIKAADYNSLLNFQAGVNYEINDLWGVRATYAYHSFENKDNSNFGVTYNKFMAEATFNVLTAINQNLSVFDVVAHGGVGGTFATQKQKGGTNKIGNLQIGLKPTYAVSERINVFLDATYIMNFNQAHEFNGVSIKGGTTGGYLGVNVGIQVKLGQ